MTCDSCAISPLIIRPGGKEMLRIFFKLKVGPFFGSEMFSNCMSLIDKSLISKPKAPGKGLLSNIIKNFVLDYTLALRLQRQYHLHQDRVIEL